MSDHFSLETATKGGLTTLTQYIFRAMGEKGVGSVTSSRDAMLINMSKLMPASDRFHGLFSDPPVVDGLPELYVPNKDATVAYAPYAEQLGDVDCALPECYLPVGAPFWLGAALANESESADRLIGVHVLQKLDNCWSLGVIEAPNDSPEVTVTVTKEGLSGERMANF